MTEPESLMALVESLERKLSRLEDIEEVKAVQRRYIRKLADRDWEGLADYFTEDAVTDIRWHGKTVGKQELIEHVFGDLKKILRTADAYVLSSPVVELEAGSDTAYAEWTWHRHICEFRMSGGYMRVWGPWLEGRYRCHYARVDGRWLIKSMWFRVVLPDPDPSAEEMQARLESSERHVIGGGIIER